MNQPAPSNQLMENLSGALDVMFGNNGGLSRIDQSTDGFWWSFAGLGLAGLIDVSALAMRYGSFHAQVMADPPGKIWFIIASLAIALIAYGAGMILLYLLCREPAERANFFRTLIIHNWAAPIISVAVLPFIVAGSLNAQALNSANPPLIWQSVMLFITGLLCVAGVRLIRWGLDIPLSRALWFFAVTAFASLIVAEGLQIAAGLSVQS